MHTPKTPKTRSVAKNQIFDALKKDFGNENRAAGFRTHAMFNNDTPSEKMTPYDETSRFSNFIGRTPDAFGTSTPSRNLSIDKTEASPRSRKNGLSPVMMEKTSNIDFTALRGMLNQDTMKMRVDNFDMTCAIPVKRVLASPSMSFADDSDEENTPVDISPTSKDFSVNANGSSPVKRRRPSVSPSRTSPLQTPEGKRSHRASLSIEEEAAPATEEEIMEAPQIIVEAPKEENDDGWGNGVTPRRVRRTPSRSSSVAEGDIPHSPRATGDETPRSVLSRRECKEQGIRVVETELPPDRRSRTPGRTPSRSTPLHIVEDSADVLMTPGATLAAPMPCVEHLQETADGLTAAEETALANSTQRPSVSSRRNSLAVSLVTGDNTHPLVILPSEEEQHSEGMSVRNLVSETEDVMESPEDEVDMEAGQQEQEDNSTPVVDLPEIEEDILTAPHSELPVEETLLEEAVVMPATEEIDSIEDREVATSEMKEADQVMETDQQELDVQPTPSFEAAKDHVAALVSAEETSTVEDAAVDELVAVTAAVDETVADSAAVADSVAPTEPALDPEVAASLEEPSAPLSFGGSFDSPAARTHQTAGFPAAETDVRTPLRTPGSRETPRAVTPSAHLEMTPKINSLPPMDNIRTPRIQQPSAVESVLTPQRTPTRSVRSMQFTGLETPRSPITPLNARSPRNPNLSLTPTKSALKKRDNSVEMPLVAGVTPKSPRIHFGSNQISFHDASSTSASGGSYRLPTEFVASPWVWAPRQWIDQRSGTRFLKGKQIAVVAASQLRPPLERFDERTGEPQYPASHVSRIVLALPPTDPRVQARLSPVEPRDVLTLSMKRSVVSHVELTSWNGTHLQNMLKPSFISADGQDQLIPETQEMLELVSVARVMWTRWLLSQLTSSEATRLITGEKDAHKQMRVLSSALLAREAVDAALADLFDTHLVTAMAPFRPDESDCTLVELSMTALCPLRHVADSETVTYIKTVVDIADVFTEVSSISIANSECTRQEARFAFFKALKGMAVEVDASPDVSSVLPHPVGLAEFAPEHPAQWTRGDEPVSAEEGLVLAAAVEHWRAFVDGKPLNAMPVFFGRSPLYHIDVEGTIMEFREMLRARDERRKRKTGQ